VYKRIIALFLSCAITCNATACTFLYETQESKEVQEEKKNETLVSLLIPESAEIITNLDDLLVLESTLPLQELIDFYRTVLFELQVSETGLNDNHEGIWIYSGIYDLSSDLHRLPRHDGRKPITIELREDEQVKIYIIY